MTPSEAHSKVEQAASAMVARLLRDNGRDCEIVAFAGRGRCRERAVAARFDGLFIDLVCAEHAERSKSRTGTALVYARAKEATDD